MTNATRERRTGQRVKSARFVRVLHREEWGIVIAIGFRTARTFKTQCYIVEPVPGSMFGEGFMVEKEDGVRYATNVNGEKSECDCRGYGKWGRCKHVSALLALARDHKLPKPQPTRPIIPIPRPVRPAAVLSADPEEWGDPEPWTDIDPRIMDDDGEAKPALPDPPF